MSTPTTNPQHAADAEIVVHAAADVAEPLARELRALHDTAIATGAPPERAALLATARVADELVGYASAEAGDGVVDIPHVVVTPAIWGRHSDVIGALAASLVDAAGMPWADVRLPADSPALGPLLNAGWRRAATGAGHDVVVLSGSRAG